MTPNADTLAARAKWLREQLDSIPRVDNANPCSGSDWIAARTRRVQALDAMLAQLRALPDLPTVCDSGMVATVRMLGITSTSTMGIEGALRNWLTRAECGREGR